MPSAANISAQINGAKARGFLPYFQKAARRRGISLATLLAVASRETQIGTDSYYLNNNFVGKDGHGRGIMQVDDRHHAFARTVSPADHAANINYGAKYLSDMRDQFGSIKDALVAYNAGPDAVQHARAAGMDPDFYTTGGNYAADVLQRAKLIRKELGMASAAVTMATAVLVLLGGGSYLYYQWQQTAGGRRETWLPIINDRS